MEKQVEKMEKVLDLETLHEDVLAEEDREDEKEEDRREKRHERGKRRF